MRGLDIPTTHALAMGSARQTVWRRQAESAAVLTRLAPNFIRFGYFEYFFCRNQPERLQELADWVILHHCPECQTAPKSYLAVLNAVIDCTVTLIAK